MRYFPSFVDLRGGSVLVVGARDQAIAKLRLLLRTEAALEVVAPEADAPVVAWASAGRLTWTARRFVPADAERRRLVFVATGEVVRNREIALVARAFCGLVTVVDDREASTALTPAIIDRDPVIVAVSSGGYAPSLARRIKAEIEALLPSGVGALARLAAGARRSAPRLGAPSLRAALARFFGGAGERALRAGGEAAAQAALDRLLAEASRTTPQGSVALVGAGPGDPDLLTLKARRLLDRAEVVLYDRLVDPRVLELARREARLIDVGKAPGGPGWSQDAINALMVEAARAGSRVVRLKSGDPLVFGRADEEIAALDAAGIEREIVPGITAAVAAAASAGFSQTRRGRPRAGTPAPGAPPTARSPCSPGRTRRAWPSTTGRRSRARTARSRSTWASRQRASSRAA
jgi:uroporphyrin-III C-methyltransferase/precorrin-2 dehydrogenase/sirohydrochlorin ferrochelatase